MALTSSVIPSSSPEDKEAKSPEDNAVLSSEITEKPTSENPKKSVTTIHWIQYCDEVTLTTKEEDDQSSKVPAALLKPSPSLHVMASLHHQEQISSNNVGEAWEKFLFPTQVFNEIVLDHTVEALNYNQVSVRDFVPSGLAYMMHAKPELQTVKNFLLFHLQSWEKKVDNFTLAEGVMAASLPDSFKVLPDSPQGRDILKADFGGSAIGGFLWILLLRSYSKCSQDYTLSEMPEMQRSMRWILNLCLSDGFDTFPTLLCIDDCSMIDMRMGDYGYPIEIQALFFFALRCARQMLKPERGGKELLEQIDKRIIALRYHIRTYFWVDNTQLSNIYRYKTEEYSHTAVNKFNVIPDSIPEWVVGNCIFILSSLATPEQETAIMDLFEERWQDLIGEMPLKIAYPALEGSKWRNVTGCDPKNTSWSYHNRGSWPVLIWLFTAACIKSGRPQIATKAIELAEKRLSKDGWPEYYDGKTGMFIGKQARKLQTCTIFGYLVAKHMIDNPTNVFLFSLEEDTKTEKPDSMEASFNAEEAYQPPMAALKRERGEDLSEEASNKQQKVIGRSGPGPGSSGYGNPAQLSNMAGLGSSQPNLSSSSTLNPFAPTFLPSRPVIASPLPYPPLQLPPQGGYYTIALTSPGGFLNLHGEDTGSVAVNVSIHSLYGNDITGAQVGKYNGQTFRGDFHNIQGAREIIFKLLSHWRNLREQPDHISYQAHHEKVWKSSYDRHSGETCMDQQQYFEYTLEVFSKLAKKTNSSISIYPMEEG